MKWKFKRFVVKLLRYNNTPREIALGIAIGVFIGTLPLYGLHTVLVVIAAFLVRPSNKIAIFLGTNVSLPPTIPFITWAGYEIGRLILWGSYDSLRWADFKSISWNKVLSLYRPLFLGSVVLGIVLGIIAYFLTYFLVSRWKARRKHGRAAKGNY